MFRAALITLGLVVVGILVDKLESYVKTIADAVVNMRGDVEAIRSETGTIATEVQALRTVVAKSLLLPVLALLCVGCSSTAPARTVDVSAAVLSSATQQPIAQATIDLISPPQRWTTDAAGHVTLILPVGAQSFHVSAVGYRDVVFPETIGASGDLVFYLAPLP